MNRPTTIKPPRPRPTTIPPRPTTTAHTFEAATAEAHHGMYKEPISGYRVGAEYFTMPFEQWKRERPGVHVSTVRKIRMGEMETFGPQHGEKK